MAQYEEDLADYGEVDAAPVISMWLDDTFGWLSQWKFMGSIRETYVGEEKWDAYEGYREVFWKEGDLVRKVDYYGTGYGEDYKKAVGDQVGQVIEIDEDIDGTQYTVLFADGSTIMDVGDSFEAAK
jgi:hypothetical protein